jgi:hypothetical protein
MMFSANSQGPKSLLTVGGSNRVPELMIASVNQSAAAEFASCASVWVRDKDALVEIWRSSMQQAD